MDKESERVCVWERRLEKWRRRIKSDYDEEEEKNEERERDIATLKFNKIVIYIYTHTLLGFMLWHATDILDTTHIKQLHEKCEKNSSKYELRVYSQRKRERKSLKWKWMQV